MNLSTQPSALSTSAAHARALLTDPRTIILDTETTGLGDDAEIIEIAVITPQGETLLDTLIRPTRPIPLAASMVHGIEDDHVDDAPTFADIWPRLRSIIDDKLILTYNAEFDLRLIEQSFVFAQVTDPFICDSDCIMQLAANHLHHKRWLRQERAAWLLDLKPHPPAHRALGDARTALAILRAIAGVTEHEGQPE